MKPIIPPLMLGDCSATIANLKNILFVLVNKGKMWLQMPINNCLKGDSSD